MGAESSPLTWEPLSILQAEDYRESPMPSIVCERSCAAMGQYSEGIRPEGRVQRYAHTMCHTVQLT